MIATAYLSTKVLVGRHVEFVRCSSADIQNWSATQLNYSRKLETKLRLYGASLVFLSCSHRLRSVSSDQTAYPTSVVKRAWTIGMTVSVGN